MKITRDKWQRVMFCILGIATVAAPARTDAACWGDGAVVAEYLFFEGSGSAVLNTGLDGDDGNAALTNGVGFNAAVPPPNLSCGWSINLPGTGSGSTTPGVETSGAYDPLAGTNNFTIMAWVRRESGSAGSNTSARIVSDTSSLTLTNTTAGIEFRFSGSSGTLALRVNGNEVGTTTGGIPPNSNEWRHVAVVYDGTRPATNPLTRNVHFYVDGIQRGDGNTLHNVLVGANTNRLTLGNSSVGRAMANTLVGKLDDVVILKGAAPPAVGNGKTSETIRCYMNLNDDIERPVIAPPPNVTTNNDQGQCSSTNVILGQPAASDNCAVASITQNAPAVFPVGTTPVIWTAIDQAGNQSSCTQMVSVIDVEYPQITCPSNVWGVAGECLAGVTNVDLGWPLVLDNCSVSAVYPSGDLSEYPVGTTPVVWHALDAAGNQSTCTQEVSVLPSQSLDCDGDGLTDWEELMVYLSDPEDPCTAGDGLSDGWKVQFGFDPAMVMPTECRPAYW